MHQIYTLRQPNSTLYRWIREYRALKLAVPYEAARDALVSATRGAGLVSVTEGGLTLSAGYAAGLLKYPVPDEGTSPDECWDWALQVRIEAEKHVSAKAARESWQIHGAKARFSEVFRRARTEGPQRITRQGKEGVVMVAEEQFEQLLGRSRQPKSLVQFFRASPLVGVNLDLKRDRDGGRDIEL